MLMKHMFALLEGMAVEDRDTSEVIKRKYGTREGYYVTFTDVNKVGINPNYSFGDTPKGIYAYQLAWYAGIANGNVIVANNCQYVSVIKENPNANIVHLDKVTDEMLVEYTSRLGRTDLGTVEQIEEYLDSKHDRNTSKKTEKPASHNGYLLYELIYGIYSNGPGKSGPISEWSKIYRSIGIDGLVDNGHSIIYPELPYQCVFFSSSAINVVETFNNNGQKTIVSNTMRGANDGYAGRATKLIKDNIVAISKISDTTRLTIDKVLGQYMRQRGMIERIGYDTVNSEAAIILHDPDIIHKLVKNDALSYKNAIAICKATGSRLMNASRTALTIACAMAEHNIRDNYKTIIDLIRKDGGKYANAVLKKYPDLKNYYGSADKLDDNTQQKNMSVLLSATDASQISKNDVTDIKLKDYVEAYILGNKENFNIFDKVARIIPKKMTDYDIKDTMYICKLVNPEYEHFDKVEQVLRLVMNHKIQPKSKPASGSRHAPGGGYTKYDPNKWV